MEQNMQNFKCPQCGKQLLIPQELEEFSCLYCGARLRASALRQPKPDAQTAEHPEGGEAPQTDAQTGKPDSWNGATGGEES